MSTPRKTPRQQRSRDTVAVILEAAAQLFQRGGYAATTTNHVADRAGVSIGSIYQYFPNKDSLLVALAERHLAAVDAELGHVFASLDRDRPGLRATVERLVRAVADIHLDRPDLHHLLFDQTPRTKQLVAALRTTERRLAAAVAAELRRLGAGGPDPTVTGLLVVQGIEAQVHGALLDTPPPERSDAESTLVAIIDLWTRALSEPSGQ